jgi:hypothetical protein
MSKFEENSTSLNRERITKNEGSTEDIKKQLQEAMASGDADKIIELGGQMKSLKGQKKEFIDQDEEEAYQENEERMKRGELTEKGSEKTMYEEAQAEDAAREKVKIAEDAKRQAEEDAKKYAEALEKIQGKGNEVEKDQDLSDSVDLENARLVAEKTQENAENKDLGFDNLVGKIGAPKTEMFKKYGERMHQAADKLVLVVKEMRENEKKLIEAEHGSAEWKKLWDENNALNDRRNELRSDATWGGKVIKFRGQKYGEESYVQYEKYRSKETDAYNKTAMDDPYVVLRLAEADQLDRGYGNNEGIGKINSSLRSNSEFMEKVLDSISRNGAESFWAHVEGKANNRELYIKAIKKNHLNYQWGAKEWKSDPEIQKVALESGLNPTYLYKG